MILNTLRWLRHKPLKGLGPFWVLGGKSYRALVRILKITKPIKQKIGPYGPFKLHPHFSFSNFADWGGGHNKGFEACIEACRGKDCVLDVGGHIGLIALPVAQVIKSGGTVVSFEPSTVNHGFLSYHKQVNNMDNLEIVRSLVGAKSADKVEFFEDTADSGMNSILHLENKGNFERHERSQVTLDEFCVEKNYKPDVIKIDVEGAELFVLQGAQTILKEHKPLIFLSVHPRHLEKLGIQQSALLELAKDIGYKITDLDGGDVTKFELDEYLMAPIA